MQLTRRHFRTSLVEYFTTAVYTLGGEFELRALVSNTIYANETDIQKQKNVLETAWRKKRADSSTRSKVQARESCRTRNGTKQQIVNRHGF